jgi:hypothetical protein
VPVAALTAHAAHKFCDGVDADFAGDTLGLPRASMPKGRHHLDKPMSERM